jgi:hypothetical protein
MYSIDTKLPALLHYQVEDPAHVRRYHLLRRTYLLSQKLPRPLARRQLRTHRLQRHIHPELQVEGAVHLAIPPRPRASRIWYLSPPRIPPGLEPWRVGLSSSSRAMLSRH